MKVSGGMEEGGIVVGNTYDKYNSGNPVVRWMMRGFAQKLEALVTKVNPKSIHEVGCGEGYWVLKWNDAGINARGSDFSTRVINLAKLNAEKQKLSTKIFNVGSIYELQASDSADLIVCCEVLEHLEDPEAGLYALQKIVKGHLIVSVPREPIWCALNMVRGKYLLNFGNTPGHLQHWSSTGFTKLISNYFDVIEIAKPFPWTMLLCQAKT